MKRVFFLLLMALVLVGCSLDEAAEDTTASLSSAEQASQEIVRGELQEMQCAGFLMPSLDQAQLSFLLEVSGLKLGSGDPQFLYGSGVVDLPKAYGKEGASIDCVELMETAVVELTPATPQSKKIYVGHLPFRVEIDGTPTAIEGATLTGLSLWADENFEVGKPNGERLGFLMNSVCFGQTIPGTTVATVAFVAQLEDGEQTMVNGLMDTGQEAGNTSQFFTCAMEKEGFIMPAQSQTSSFEIFEIPMFFVEVEGDAGFLIPDAFILGFNIGMPPT